MIANQVRGEAELRLGGAAVRLRPSFERLVAAEAELGSLFALVERAADGRLSLAETATLLWHCLDPAPEGWDRARLGEALVAGGLANATAPLRAVLTQILQGR